MEKKIQPDWFSLSLVQRVIDVLGPDNIRFVGGAVRDTLLGRAVEDIDAACRHHPATTTGLLKRAGVKVIPTGIDHGTVTAVLDGQTIEITTLRSDTETDGRHATVAFTDDWLEDAARRDFTFNALYLSSGGELYDPYGGVADLKAGRVRFIGDAEMRIKEDALRIMRFFRFHAWYGTGPLDDAGLAASKHQIALLGSLSAERVRAELLKMFSAPAPFLSIRSFAKIGGSEVLKLVAVNERQLEVYLSSEKEQGIAIDPLLRLACWVSLGSDKVNGFARRFRFSNKEKERLRAAAKGLEVACPEDEREMRKLYYELGPDAAQVSIMTQPEAVGQGCFDVLNAWQIPTFPVKGGDLIARGALAGPEISRKLEQLEALWIKSDFQLGKNDLLSRL